VETQTQHAAHVREMRNDMQNFSRKHEGKEPLGRSRRNWKDAMNVDHKEIRYEAVDCVHLSGQSPPCPENAGNMLTSISSTMLYGVGFHLRHKLPKNRHKNNDFKEEERKVAKSMVL
jgi:hypothetical protein